MRKERQLGRSRDRSVRRGATALVAVFALVLAACGGDDPDDGAATDDDAVAAADEDGDGADDVGDDAGEDVPPECDVTQGVTDDTIHLTMLNDLSGPTAALGAPAIGEAFRAHFDAINAAGGIDGREVEVEILDHGYSPVEAAQRYEEVRTDTAMVASVFGSPPLQAIAQDLVDDCLLSFQSGSSGQLAQAYDTIYSPTTPYGHEILNIIGWVIEEQGEEDATFAFAYQSDALGEAIRQAAEFGAEFYGFEFAAETTHGPQDSDLSAQLQTLLAADPDYIVYGGLPSQLAFLSAGALAAGSDVQFISATPGFVPAVLATPAADAVQANVFISGPYTEWEGDEPGRVTMREEIETHAPDVAPGQGPVIGYSTAMVVAEVLRIASASGDLSLWGLRQAAAQVADYDADGLLPALTYGQYEDAPRIGSHASRIWQPEAGPAQGMVPLTELFESEASQAYTEPVL
jgi:ABC-type branched-subunit amino acid transport system substrate-binding protein